MLLPLIIGFITFVKCQFVIDSLGSTCDLVYIDNMSVSRQDWESNYNGTEIRFNLCKNLSDKYENYMAYIKNKNGSKTVFNKISVLPGKKLKFDAVGNSSCKLSVQFLCNMYTEKPKVQLRDECDYEVSLFSSSSRDGCRPYGMMFHDKLLDFRPLQRIYDVFDIDNKILNYRLSFCNEIENCKLDLRDSDKLKDANITTVQFEKIIYNGNEFELQTSYRTQKKKKIKLKVFIKCNWFENATKLNLLYKENKYIYGMTSSLGCLKQPPVCQVLDKHFIYDLSGLYRKEGYWEVQKLNGSRKIYFNVCGPLPKTLDTCCKSSSQVCEINNGTYISRGRISSPLVPVVTEDSIFITFLHGDAIAENKFYSTKIQFSCSPVDGQPTLLGEQNNELLIGWKTTKACPRNNPKSCPEKFHNMDPDLCLYNKDFLSYSVSYNLTELYEPNGHLVKDPRNSSYVYLVNVCGPINITEAPCKKNVMVAKIFLHEPDYRKKVISYGQTHPIVLENNSLIIHMTEGDYFKHTDALGYYNSRLQFECNENVESEIFLQNETNDSLNFIWKTKRACSKVIIKKCIFYGEGNNVLNFTQLNKDSLFVKDGGVQYLFDLCGRQENNSKCDHNICHYVKAGRNLINYNNKPHIEFILKHACNDTFKYNRTLVELVCDNLTDNDHFKDRMFIENCTLMVQLQTVLACSNKAVIIPLINKEKSSNINASHVYYNVVPDRSNTSSPLIHKTMANRKTNCTVISPYNSFMFNISDLQLNLTSSTSCPKNSFNLDNKTITLLYHLPKSCHHSKDSLELLVELNCEDKFRKNKTENYRCSRKMTFFLPAACKLLDFSNTPQIQSGSISGGLITAYILISIILFALLIFGGRWIYKRRNRWKSYDALTIPYSKDADE